MDIAVLKTSGIAAHTVPALLIKDACWYKKRAAFLNRLLVTMAMLDLKSKLFGVCIYIGPTI